MKKKCCHVRILSPNEYCSEDNLDQLIDVQQYNPLIHRSAVKRVKDSSCDTCTVYATIEGTKGKSTELFQAVVQHSVRLNGKLPREKPRNMIQQLLERPK